MDFIHRAKIIIDKIQYLTIATADKNRQPWNTAVYTSFDENYTFFWISSPLSQHSKNISENNNVFLLIYDSSIAESTGEGVYMQDKAYELQTAAEIEHAKKYHYGRKFKDPRSTKDFLGESPRRFYKAVPEKYWINTHEKVAGHHVDKRVEVRLI